MNFSGLIPKRVVIYYNLPRSHPAVAQSTELCVLIVNLCGFAAHLSADGPVIRYLHS